MINIIDLLIDLFKKEEKEESFEEGIPLRIEAPEYERNKDDEDENNKENNKVIIIDL